MSGFGAWLSGKTPTGIWKGADLERYNAGRRNWVTAKLRDESGAAIAEHEFDNQYKTFFPEPGDAPETIETKRKLRNSVESDMARTSAPQLWPSMEEYNSAIVQGSKPTPRDPKGSLTEEQYEAKQKLPGDIDSVYNSKTGKVEKRKWTEEKADDAAAGKIKGAGEQLKGDLSDRYNQIRGNDFKYTPPGTDPSMPFKDKESLMEIARFIARFGPQVGSAGAPIGQGMNAGIQNFGRAALGLGNYEKVKNLNSTQMQNMLPAFVGSKNAGMLRGR
jgi:hypothetical protein